MADRDDTIRKVAALIRAAVYGDRTVTALAERLLPALGITWDGSVTAGSVEAGLRNAFGTVLDREQPGRVLTESQLFQVQEARDILGTWDLNRPGGVSRETLLADQVRALLAVIDEKGAGR